ncbi:helix-turn-helix domain-containing protein [Croceitalea rosinachiae]|uniref:Helix-turn-helix domain-containing protein n=1 Tax=Croceitalea rosinachiae TaxID=3075596 RepID=A0ABU3A5N3_9FLAO|nr:helix-turn-helix domain-containing protein [Croceitalea sp. F388]MDT0605482.1 helix-turn-helix domain-containing protein [Croceitalea sp. F388]
MNLDLTTTLIFFGLLQSTIMIFLIIKNRNWKLVQNKLLISLLLVIGLSLVPTFLGRSGFVAQYDYLRFIPFNLVIFVFPLLFLYFKAIYNSTFRLNYQNSFHLIIPMIFWLYYWFIWLGSLTIIPERKASWVLEMGYFKVQFVHDVILLLLLCTYSLLSLIELREKKGLNGKYNYTKWVKYLIIFLFFGVALELTSALLGKIYGYWKSSPLDIWLGFSLTMIVKIYNAVLIYVISLLGYLSYSTFKSSRKIIDKNVLNKKLQDILEKMEIEKPYLNSDFSLASFAKQLQTNPSVLSNLLNNHLNISFNDFTNKYRIAEVKDKLKAGLQNSLTLESIAKDSGFKSKTTFYRAFHRHTSQTPKGYLNQISKNKKVS